MSQFFFVNSLPISYSFSLTCRYQYNEHENDFANSLGLDFEKTIYTSEFGNDKGMKDDDLKIRITLSPATRKELIDLLRDYSDVFAWSY